jgi:hypothetical protein
MECLPGLKFVVCRGCCTTTSILNASSHSSGGMPKEHTKSEKFENQPEYHHDLVFASVFLFRDQSEFMILI